MSTRSVSSYTARAGVSAWALLAGCLLVTEAVVAQTAPWTALPHETVTTRPRPAYDPAGLEVGSFRLFPSLGLKAEYDSNLFQTNANETGDIIFSVSPSIFAASQWSNHSLTMSAGGDSRHHLDVGDENTVDWNLAADGRVDIQRDSYLFAGAAFNDLHEGRGDPSSPGTSREPVEYDKASVGGGLFHRFSRLSVRLNGTLDDYAYDNAVDRRTGATILQKDRDRSHLRIAGRLAYELTPGYDAFLQGAWFNRSYDRLQGAANRFDRDSSGYQAVVGLDLDLGGLLFGEVFLGWRSQDYDDRRLSTIDGATGGASIYWNPTGLTSAYGYFTRTVEETTIASSSGYFASTVGVQVDHELLRNLLLKASASYSDNDYQGVTRNDDYVRFGLGARYLLNRNLSVGLDYAHDSRDSNQAGQDYSDNVTTLKLEVGL